MCEFKVFIDDVQVAEDVVFASVEGGKVILRDVLGESHI
jgi:predicted RNA-binding protein